MPFLVSDVPIRIGASAGILVSDKVLAASSTSQLLEQVDCALYAAKRAGGGGWAWSDAEAEFERRTG